MRFSLKFLILLTLLLGIGISFVPMLSSIRSTDAKTAEIQLQIDQKVGNLNYLLRQSDAVAKETDRLATEQQRLKTVREQMGQIFGESAAPEGQVITREGMLSVREIPLLDSGDGFHKQFQLSVPEDRKFRLRMRFTDFKGEDSNGQEDFTLPDRRTVPLNPGHQVVEITFRKPDAADANSKITPRLVVSVAGQPVFESRFKYPKSNGGSWSNFPFEQQRDYKAGKKLPRLVNFQPNPGKTNVVLSIEELQNGEP